MAGGPYNIPRNTKGEGRFLYIFSPKALIVTAIFIVFGYVLLYPVKIMMNGNSLPPLIAAGILGLIGFVSTSFKIPDSNNFEITRKAGRRIYR